MVIVLVLLAVMGLTTAVAMRTALTTQKVTTALRFDAVAQQSAEFALRRCEAEIERQPGQRTPALAQVENQSPTPFDQLRWTQSAAWLTPPAPSADWALFALPPGAVATVRSPECLVETLLIPNGPNKVLVITARGFSPDYSLDAASGRTLTGSVAWLQSFLYYD